MVEACRTCGFEPGVDKQGRVVDRHDCHHVLTIDSVIHEAERCADRSYGFSGEGTAARKALTAFHTSPIEWFRAEVWNEMYFRAVDRLLAERGVYRKRAEDGSQGSL